MLKASNQGPCLPWSHVETLKESGILREALEVPGFPVGVGVSFLEAPMLATFLAIAQDCQPPCLSFISLFILTVCLLCACCGNNAGVAYILMG